MSGPRVLRFREFAIPRPIEMSNDSAKLKRINNARTNSLVIAFSPLPPPHVAAAPYAGHRAPREICSSLRVAI